MDNDLSESDRYYFPRPGHSEAILRKKSRVKVAKGGRRAGVSLEKPSRQDDALQFRHSVMGRLSCDLESFSRTPV